MMIEWEVINWEEVKCLLDDVLENELLIEARMQFFDLSDCTQQKVLFVPQFLVYLVQQKHLILCQSF